MTTKVETMNGQERKTLASQLDRLDTILDCLSDGLNQAVGTAVEKAVELAVKQAVGQAVAQAVHEAVQAVLTEVLTNTDLRAALREVTAPTEAQPPATPSEQTSGVCSRVGGWVKAGLGKVRNAVGYVLGQVTGLKPAARAAWGLASHYRLQLLAACGVGGVIGLTALWTGPWLGAAAGWGERLCRHPGRERGRPYAVCCPSLLVLTDGRVAPNAGTGRSSLRSLRGSEA